MSLPTERTRRYVMAAAAAATVAVASVGATSSVGAQSDDGDTESRLDLVSQTLFVDENPVQFVIQIDDAPIDARLEVTILETPSRTLEDVRAAHAADTASGPRLSFFECPLDQTCAVADLEFADDGLTTITLLEEEIGEALRERTGALSLTVRLLDDSGVELDAFNTTLLVLDDNSTTVDFHVGFVGRVNAPLAHQRDQTLRLDTGAVGAATASLRARPELPVAIELRPETLEALQQVNPSALAELRDAVGERTLLRAPWVDTDEEAWRAVGADAQVVAQYALGNDTTETLIGRTPSPLVRLDADATPETLGLMRTVGAGAVVVDNAQVRLGTNDLSRYQPFQLVDDNQVAITAMRIDDAFHRTLAHADPELGAYQALAELMIAVGNADHDLALLLDIDTLDPTALDVFLDGISSRRELHTSAVPDLLDLEPARNQSGELRRGALLATTPPDVAPLAAELRTVTTALDTFAAMVAPEIGPITPLRTQLLAAVSADLTGQQARRYADVVFDQVLAGTSGIEIAPSGRITLTDRRTDLPLTIVNNQPLPINVELLLSAEKLRFPEGERLTLRLRPGDNHETIPVETLASGDARVTATLISPGGLFELGSGTVDIRSTALSGLGLVISVGALAVLGAWWIRTILRVRRNRAAATVAAAPVVGDDAGAPAPDKGET